MSAELLADGPRYGSRLAAGVLKISETAGGNREALSVERVWSWMNLPLCPEEVEVLFKIINDLRKGRRYCVSP